MFLLLLQFRVQSEAEMQCVPACMRKWKWPDTVGGLWLLVSRVPRELNSPTNFSNNVCSCKSTRLSYVGVCYVNTHE